MGKDTCSALFAEAANWPTLMRPGPRWPRRARVVGNRFDDSQRSFLFLYTAKKLPISYEFVPIGHKGLECDRIVRVGRRESSTYSPPRLASVRTCIIEFKDYVPRQLHRYLDNRVIHRLDLAMRRMVEEGILDDDTSIEMIRGAYALEAKGVQRVGQALGLSESDLRRELGDAAFEILQGDLAARNLRLGMRAPGWTPAPLPPWLQKIL